MRKIMILLICFCSLAAPLKAEERFPGPGWKDQPNPLASADAYVGGEISVWAFQYPKSLNYYLDNNSLNAELFGAMFETLLSMHPITLAYEPGLAQRWSISDDKKTFTFHLNQNARWSDGTPITAHDVRWTYDAIMDPKNLTGVHKVDMERFNPPVVLDRHTIRFTARDIHWRNLGAAGNFFILCKNAYESIDFNKINFEFPVVSGPYRLGEINEGVYLNLTRRDNYWNKDSPGARQTNNFETLQFRFYAERENAFEAFKKGLIDFYPVYTSRLWINETKGQKFAKNWIIKQKIFNHKPFGFQGFAMNMRKPPFDDVKVRQAMAHLVDRRKMNRTLMYRQYILHRSYFEDLYSKENPNPNPLIEFDPARAQKLLHDAGWRVNPKTGLLEKNGRTFSFQFLTREGSSEKFITIFAEDLKDVGIELTIDKKDWASWARDMDGFNYQMTWAAWGASVFKDPEGMWSSNEATRKGGNNITGFKNAPVDQLIEKQKHIFDITQRNQIYRKIDRIIYGQSPYVLLWYINYTRLLYWNKFGVPKTVLAKYSGESAAYSYWWLDEDSEADLTDAIQNNTSLPARESAVYFDEVYK